MTWSIPRDDLIWLAGLAEGEACIDLQRGLYPRIRISMTDRDVIGRAASLIGCTVRMSYSRDHQPIWSAEKQGPRAVEVLEALLPFMGARRSQQIATVLSRYRARELSREYGESAPEAWASGLDFPRPPGLGNPITAVPNSRKEIA